MSYQFDSIVNRNEQMALKDMIFNRIRERSQSLSEDIQTDVMELARDSFVSKNNPFSLILETQNKKIQEKAIEAEITAEPENTTTNNTEIGFPQKQFAPRAVAQNKAINEQISASTIYNNMEEARVGLSTKKGFMGALEFLNTQAAVSLARTRADRFEMIV